MGKLGRAKGLGKARLSPGECAGNRRYKPQGDGQAVPSTLPGYLEPRRPMKDMISATGAFVLSGPGRRALNGFLSTANVRFFERPDELIGAVRDQMMNSVIVEPTDKSNESTAPIVRRIRAACPSIPIVVYTGVTPREVRSLVPIIRAGADAVIVRGIDDLAGRLEEVIEESTVLRVAGETLTELELILAPEVVAIFTFCFENAARDLSVQTVADALTVHRRTLVNRLSSEGLPGPAWIIAWCRLLIASRLLEDPARSVPWVAASLGFSSASAFRALCKRHTGCRPLELRQRGGARYMINLIRDRLNDRTQQFGSARA